MMVKIEDSHENLPPSHGARALSVLLGFAVCFAFTQATTVVSGALVTNTFLGPWAWKSMVLLALYLLICVGAFWSLLQLRPSRPRTVVMLVLLLFLACYGIAGLTVTVRGLFDLATKISWGNIGHGLVKGWSAPNTPWASWAWTTTYLLAMNLLVSLGAICASLWLKPWRGWDELAEPLSPATRKSNNLMWLSVAVVGVSALALIFGTQSDDTKNLALGMFSNRPVPLGVAAFVIVGWLVGMGIVNKWWWYISADEHERKSDDFGNLVGWGLFVVVTPAWWLAARAGLVPQPNAMVLWLITTWVSAICWFWRRNR